MNAPITVISHSERVERLLERFRQPLGADFDAYRGHVYRVLSYAKHFLGGDAQQQPLVEAALVYHDIALWTEGELAYLEPSEALALKHNAAEGWGLDAALLHAAIHWHHKITPYAGPGAALVNAVRKADWIDASGGLIRKGLTAAQVAAVRAAIPDPGFAAVLQRLARELGGSALRGNLRVLRRVMKL